MLGEEAIEVSVTLMLLGTVYGHFEKHEEAKVCIYINDRLCKYYIYIYREREREREREKETENILHFLYLFLFSFPSFLSPLFPIHT